MKKFFAVAILLFALGSCGEDITFNDRAVVQGDKDNVFWKGSDATATITGNKVVVTAVTLNETLTLQFNIPATPIDPKNHQTYIVRDLGVNNTGKATYTFKDDAGVETLYDTGTSATDDGDGQIVISEYGNGVVSGTFRFNAVNTDPDSEANHIVNYQNGVFYRVPIQ